MDAVGSRGNPDGASEACRWSTQKLLRPATTLGHVIPFQVYCGLVIAWALLQEARRRSGLTQAELADRAGVPQSTVAKIERGRRDPSLSTLERLVRAAGLELRVQLEPRDDHDLQLIDLMLDLTPEERLESLERQIGAFAEAEALSDRR